MLGIADSVIGVAGKILDKFVEDKDQTSDPAFCFIIDKALVRPRHASHC